MPTLKRVHVAGSARATCLSSELLADYHQAIVTAFGDAEAALDTVDGSQAQADAQAEAVQARLAQLQAGVAL